VFCFQIFPILCFVHSTLPSINTVPTLQKFSKLPIFPKLATLPTFPKFYTLSIIPTIHILPKLLPFSAFPYLNHNQVCLISVPLCCGGMLHKLTITDFFIERDQVSYPILLYSCLFPYSSTYLTFYQCIHLAVSLSFLSYVFVFSLSLFVSECLCMLQFLRLCLFVPSYFPAPTNSSSSFRLV